MDGAGLTTAADVPTAGSTAAVIPADGPGGDELLHATLQHSAFLCPGGIAQEDTQGCAREEEVRDEIEKTSRKSAGYSS